jgi:hypothetical protein
MDPRWARRYCPTSEPREMTVGWKRTAKKLAVSASAKTRRGAAVSQPDTERALSQKPLRRSTPSRPAASINAALTDADAILSSSARLQRSAALDALARGRRDAEARAGSVKLS